MRVSLSSQTCIHSAHCGVAVIYPCSTLLHAEWAVHLYTATLTELIFRINGVFAFLEELYIVDGALCGGMDFDYGGNCWATEDMELRLVLVVM